MAPPPRKLDIFTALAAVDRRDGGWLARQPAEARREFAPPVFLRWASAVRDGSEAATTLLATNELVNTHFWTIADEHPELVFRLAALCGGGTRQAHVWIEMPKRTAVANKARDLIAKFAPLANDDEIDLLVRLHTPDSFAAFVDDTAVPPDVAKDARRAFAKLRHA